MDSSLLSWQALPAGVQVAVYRPEVDQLALIRINNVSMSNMVIAVSVQRLSWRHHLTWTLNHGTSEDSCYQMNGERKYRICVTEFVCVTWALKQKKLQESDFEKCFFPVRCTQFPTTSMILYAGESATIRSAPRLFRSKEVGFRSSVWKSIGTQRPKGVSLCSAESSPL